MFQPYRSMKRSYKNQQNVLASTVDGGYSPWSEFGSCSQTCGTGGIQRRFRTCSNPPPMNGGKSCFGNPYQSRACSTRTCPGMYGSGENRIEVLILSHFLSSIAVKVAIPQVIKELNSAVI